MSLNLLKIPFLLFSLVYFGSTVAAQHTIDPCAEVILGEIEISSDFERNAVISQCFETVLIYCASNSGFDGCLLEHNNEVLNSLETVTTDLTSIADDGLTPGRRIVWDEVQAAILDISHTLSIEDDTDTILANFRRLLSVTMDLLTLRESLR